MPYENERANPLGASVLLEDSFIRDRLKTYALIEEDSELETSQIPVIDARELAESHELEEITRLIAVDGSVTQTESKGRSYQVGAFKVGVVEESLDAMRALSSSKFIDPKLLTEAYKIHPLVGLLPGRGVGQLDGGSDRTWRDKFRYELFVNFVHLETPSVFTKKMSLLDSLKMVLPKNHPVYCSHCFNEVGEERREKVRLERGRNYSSCGVCGRGIYLTDALYLNSELSGLDNNKVFLSTMSLAERVVTAGLIECASKNELETTAFVTDGPLAIFSFRDLMNQHLLYQIQRQSPQPLLFGLEKTGDANDFSKLPEVDAALKPGSFMMLTDEVSYIMAGKRYSEKSSYSYGRRFLYKTRSGSKVFALMVPPRVGKAYERNNIRPDEWSTYPTLRTISELIEENQTDLFGVSVPALAGVAKANSAASLPKVLGEEVLTDLVRDSLGRKK